MIATATLLFGIFIVAMPIPSIVSNYSHFREKERNRFQSVDDVMKDLELELREQRKKEKKKKKKKTDLDTKDGGVMTLKEKGVFSNPYIEIEW